MTFKEKNQKRKTARAEALETHKRSTVNEARASRRLRWNGAFGTAPNHIYNLLAVGTTAIVRPDKGDDSDFIQVVK